MDETSSPKRIFWVSSALKDLKNMPGEVQDIFGYAVHLAQFGSKHQNAKPLKGFIGAGVMEVVEFHSSNTFRAVYTVDFPNAVYVLHCFQKKSVRGISTPKHEIDLIHARYKSAHEHFSEIAK